MPDNRNAVLQQGRNIARDTASTLEFDRLRPRCDQLLRIADRVADRNPERKKRHVGDDRYPRMRVRNSLYMVTDIFDPDPRGVRMPQNNHPKGVSNEDHVDIRGIQHHRHLKIVSSESDNWLSRGFHSNPDVEIEHLLYPVSKLRSINAL